MKTTKEERDDIMLLALRYYLEELGEKIYSFSSPTKQEITQYNKVLSTLLYTEKRTKTYFQHRGGFKFLKYEEVIKQLKELEK